MSADPYLLELRERRVLSDLDVQLATTLARIAGETDPGVLLACALTSRALSRGAVCLKLADPSSPELAEAHTPKTGDWIAALRRSKLVSRDGSTPLVLDDDHRLYLQRYHAYERGLVDAIEQRVGQRVDVDRASLRATLDRLFGAPRAGAPNRQKIAAMVAATRRLCVITGGPGTGKTTTVVRLLAVLQQQAQQGIDTATFPLRVTLLAPTGKAAARLRESIVQQRAHLDVDPELRERGIPDEASTIHRALGARPGRLEFRHHAGNPLETDVVIVDESSMVHLALMTRLMAAVPPHARIILLGDRDQLASVEAGAILGDICNDGRGIPGYSDEVLRDIAELTGETPPSYPAKPPSTGIWDHIVELTESRRFRRDGPMDRLATEINKGDGGACARALAISPAELDDDGAPAEEVVRLPLPRDRSLASWLAEVAAHRLDALLQSTDPQQAIAAMERFRVLCVHHQGPLGTEHVNRAFREVLIHRGLIGGAEEWYSHRPVLIQRNDYQLGLFNGDIGVAMPSPRGLRVYFPADREGRGPRAFHPARLPEHETVFAMTVHKSQGSEFDEVVLMLPPVDSTLLTRELLYTGATRARRRLIVAGDTEVLIAAVGRRVRRPSGLRDALYHRIDESSPASPSTAKPAQGLLFDDLGA